MRSAGVHSDWAEPPNLEIVVYHHPHIGTIYLAVLVRDLDLNETVSSLLLLSELLTVPTWKYWPARVTELMVEQDR